MILTHAARDNFRFEYSVSANTDFGRANLLAARTDDGAITSSILPSPVIYIHKAKHAGSYLNRAALNLPRMHASCVFHADTDREYYTHHTLL